MEHPPTVEAIIERWLKENGFDGLYQQGECSCLAGNLVPCMEDSFGCDPGVKMPCDCGEGCGFHIGPKKDYMDNQEMTVEPRGEHPLGTLVQGKVLARSELWVHREYPTDTDDWYSYEPPSNKVQKTHVPVTVTVTERSVR